MSLRSLHKCIRLASVATIGVCMGLLLGNIFSAKALASDQVVVPATTAKYSH